jgi:hypothetical protein
MPDFISGKEKGKKGRGIENWDWIGTDKSVNINAGLAVNEAFYSWHHKKGQCGKILDAISNWADRATFMHEQMPSFIYGDWLFRCYKGFFVFSKAMGNAVVTEKLRNHLRNMHIVLGLSSGWIRRKTSFGNVYPTLATGDRSFVADRPPNDDSYVDSQGRYLPADNLDHTGLDGHINDELGFQSPVKTYGKMAVALQKTFPSDGRQSLSLEEREILREVVLMRAPPTLSQRERLHHLSTVLAKGPHMERPIDIIKTTGGVAYVHRQGRGGSTCCLPSKLWYANPADSIGPWNSLPWWNVDPHFGWLSTDPPRRKAGRKATAEAHKVHDGYEVRARSIDKNHFDVAKKKNIGGDTSAILPGHLVYHFQWSPQGCSISLPGDNGTGPPSDEDDSGGCLGLGFLKR